MDLKYFDIGEGVGGQLIKQAEEKVKSGDWKKEPAYIRVDYHQCECCCPEGELQLVPEDSKRPGDNEFVHEDLTYLIEDELFQRTGKISISIEVCDCGQCDGGRHFEIKTEKTM